MKILCSLLLLAALFVAEGLACTTFCLKGGGETLLGKNYDWMIGDGLVFVNRRGVEKSAFVTGRDAPARWTSKYGSVTFNQYGKDNPSGGMNEAGLVIELMWLDETEYPAPDARPVIDVLEWIQYQLDLSASVDEVLANAAAVRIASLVKLHYIVSDRQGNSATVEFLQGRLVAHAGEKLAAPALANDSYEKSADYAGKTAAEKARSESSFDRFTRAAGRARAFAARPKTESEAVRYAFETLAAVAQKDSTQWSIVYDQQRAKIHFRSRLSPEVKTIDARAFDYGCGAPAKILDVNARGAGAANARFAAYTRAANRDLIERSFGGTPFLAFVPAAMRDELAEFADNFACAGVQAGAKPRPATAQREAEPPAPGFFRRALNYVGRLFGLV